MALRNGNLVSMGRLGDDLFDNVDEDEESENSVEQSVSPLLTELSKSTIAVVPDLFPPKSSDEEAFDFADGINNATSELAASAPLPKEAEPIDAVRRHDAILMAMIRHTPTNEVNVVRRMVSRPNSGGGDEVIEMGNATRADGAQQEDDALVVEADNCDLPLILAWAATSIWHEVRDTARAATRQCCTPTVQHRGFFSHTPPPETVVEMDNTFDASLSGQFLV